MTKSRLEAFSDGVLAIIITIMVLEMKTPHGTDFAALKPVLPVFLSYLLSFVFVGIYWNNHHHMLHLTHKVNGRILWKNLNLLFWLSLVPFVTGWVGESQLSPVPIALYGFVLFMAAIAYLILEVELIKSEGKESLLATSIGNETKGKISIALYILGIGISFVNPIISISCYTLVAIIWFIPDKRIEKSLRE